MRATVRDVAKLAGVSPKTVSNVVNGQVPVSPHTRRKVEDALTQLDYVPNLSARGLRNGRTGVIALSLPNLATAYSAMMAHHIVAAAAERGWSVQIEDTGIADGKLEAQLISRARANLIDGLILNPVLLETSAVQRGVSLPPLVLIGEVDQPIADHVWIDNVAAADAMTSLLIERGHRRIGILGAMRSATSKLRRHGYRRALRRAGIGLDRDLAIPCDRWDSAGGYLATKEWLAGDPRPDALFCFTDSMAIGALRALAEADIAVPGQVSVVGYDDVPDSAYLNPPLTTVGFDPAGFAEAVLTLLAQRIADPGRPITSQTVPFRLVERDSVRQR